jgi:hypothetical protein
MGAVKYNIASYCPRSKDLKNNKLFRKGFFESHSA